MNSQQQRLYDRIRQFSIDEGDEQLTFASRLARENGWSLSFAERAIEEYRRFVCLAVTADHTVTPSDQVDQVWHLHLTYTRSYWDRFCDEVLGRKLHHGPTKGGRAEDERYQQCYAATLDSYRRMFQTEPPADLWPEASIRFGSDTRQVRVNTARHWILPKPRFRRAGLWGMAVLPLGLLPLGWLPLGMEQFWIKAVQASLLVTALGFILFALVVWAIMRLISGKGGGRGSGCGSGCTSFLGCGGDSGGGDSGCASSGCGSGCGGGCGGGD